MERRRFLVTAGATVPLALAGCSGSPAHGLAEDAWADTEESSDTGSTVTTAEGTMTLPAGEYATRTLDLSEPYQYEVEFTVTAGGPVDVFTFEDSEYQDRYRDGEGEEIQFLDDVSVTGSDGEVLGGVLSEGEYALVFDNTGVWGAEPDGEASLEFAIVSSPPVDKLLADARSDLDSALTAVSDQVGTQSRAFDTDAVAGSLDAAGAKLDDAAVLADEDQQTRIDQLRTLIEWTRQIVGVMTSVEDGLESVESGNSYFQNERFGDAKSDLDGAVDALETAQSDLESARSTFESVETSALDGFDPGPANTAMDDLGALIETLVGFAEGLSALSRGFDLFFEGAEPYDAQQWSAAIRPLEDANEKFATAESTFRDTEENAPQNVIDSMIQLTCTAGAMKESSRLFADAARAARNRNWVRFRQLDRQAKRASDQCA